MKIVQKYSHLNGLEWILVHQPALWTEIEKIIDSIDASMFLLKESREKTMTGKMVYSPVELNKKIKEEFEKDNWDQKITRYWVTDNYELILKILRLDLDQQKEMITAEGKTPIKSYNQTDFVKERIAVEIQFGKYSFIAYDLFVKHLAFYVNNTIEVGVEILPTKNMQSQMSSGPGYYEGALYDMARQGRGVPAVPLVLVGIDA